MNIDFALLGQITVTILIGLAVYRWILKPFAKWFFNKMCEADGDGRDEMWMGS